MSIIYGVENGLSIKYESHSLAGTWVEAGEGCVFYAGNEKNQDDIVCIGYGRNVITFANDCWIHKAREIESFKIRSIMFTSTSVIVTGYKGESIILESF